jgi:hypothetical protein
MREARDWLRRAFRSFSLNNFTRDFRLLILRDERPLGFSQTSPFPTFVREMRKFYQ